MFFQIDDQLPNSQKHRDLADSVLDGDLRGPAAGFLWMMAGADCQATLSDGVVTRSQIARLMPDAGLAIELAGILVGVGLWHTPGHDCPRCDQPPEKGWVFHDWWDLGYDRADQVKTTRRKRRELKDSKLHAQVWARDCLDPSDPTIAACRYCDEELKKHDHRGTRKAHLDHVDPTKAAGPENVVLACGDCNRRKGQRSPVQAGMTLKPPPTHSATGHAPGTPAGPTPAPAHAAGPHSTMPAAGPARRPRTDADPTGSPHSAAEPTGSPREDDVTRTPDTTDQGTPDATRREGPRAPGPQRPPAPDPSQTRSGTHRVTHRLPEPDCVPVRGTRAHPGQAGSGQGVGRGVGKGQGDGQGSGQPAGSRKRRRRGRGGKSQAPEGGVTSGGACPEVEVAGRWGSPYFGHSGPPLLVEGSDCDRHGLPEPCRKCKTETE